MYTSLYRSSPTVLGRPFPELMRASPRTAEIGGSGLRPGSPTHQSLHTCGLLGMGEDAAESGPADRRAAT